MFMMRRSRSLVSLVAVVMASSASVALAYDWRPQPEKAAIMVISAHPDDEGIFFGGAIPYYTQVRQFPMVHISMTSGDWGRPPEVRETELRNADWVYGLRNEPLFPRFKDYPTNTLDQTWDVWADGVIDGDDIQEGRDKAGLYIAEQIRRYTPDVIITHDIEGEYGHNNHRATSLATMDALSLAADPGEVIAGLDPYRAPKLYIHQSEANGLGTPGYTFENWLFHDFWEETTIDSDGNGVSDTSPRLVADVGLDEHHSQGSNDASTVYRTDEGFNGHHSEWWGLYASDVGPDTLSTFTIEGYHYTAGNNWARGDFFEHIDVSSYPIFGDLNGDGQLDTADWQAYRAGMREDLSGLTFKQAYQQGDMDGDFDNDLIDFGFFRNAYDARNGQGAFSDMIAAVPEPSTWILTLFLFAAVSAFRHILNRGSG